jgi:hypothetical protein
VLTCPGDGAGKVTCGAWKFERSSAEGWGIYNFGQDSLTQPPSAWDGTTLGPSAAHSLPAGGSSLVVGFNGTGQDPEAGNGNYLLEIRNKLCSAPIDLSQRTLTVNLFIEQAADSPNPFPTDQSQHTGYFEAFNGDTIVISGCDFATGPINQWFQATCPFLLGTSVTDVAVAFRVTNPWKGKIYFDSVSF